MPDDRDDRIEKYKNVTDLNKYDRHYKVTNDGTNGDDVIERIWELCIQGRYGQIYPCGFNGDLAVAVTSIRLVPKIQEILAGHERPGQGNQGIPGFSTECAIRFPHEPELVHAIAKAICARKSRKGKGRKFTPEEIAIASARLKAWRLANKKTLATSNP
jgi:hypothetical protein